jgi:hypothetical protein
MFSWKLQEELGIVAGSLLNLFILMKGVIQTPPKKCLNILNKMILPGLNLFTS